MAEPAKVSKRSRNVGGKKPQDKPQDIEVKLPKIPIINVPTVAFTQAANQLAKPIAVAVANVGGGNITIPQASKIPEFKAESWYANDLMTASSALTPQSDIDRAKDKEKIAGQSRRMDTVIDNLRLNLKIGQAEELYIDNLIQGKKTEVKRENFTTQTIRLDSAKTKTGIEQAKHQSLQHDLTGETQLAQLNGERWVTRIASEQLELDGERKTLELNREAWQLKLEGLSTDVSHARQLLNHKKELLTEQIKGLRGW